MTRKDMKLIFAPIIYIALVFQLSIHQQANDGSASSAPSAQDRGNSRPMGFRFYQEHCGSGTVFYILAEGTITSETPKLFYQFSKKLLYSGDERPNFVFFNSPGGNLAAGLELGKMIRRLGLNTLVGGQYKTIGKDCNSQVATVNNGICYSACAYAFLGGVGRRMLEDGAFGVHQFYGAQKDTEATAQVTMTLLAAYLNEMGIGRELLDIASLTPSKKIEVLTVKQAEELNVDNSNPPLSEWRIDTTSAGKIYAYAIQRQPFRNATVTFLLMKEKNLYRANVSYKINQMFRSSEELTEAFSESKTIRLYRKDKEPATVSEILKGGYETEFPLRVSQFWKHQSDGSFTTSFYLDDKTLKLMALGQKFVFDASFPNSLRDIDPSVSFSTVRLQSVVAALSRQRP